jgi:hypothetical protein
MQIFHEMKKCYVSALKIVLDVAIAKIISKNFLGSQIETFSKTNKQQNPPQKTFYIPSPLNDDQQHMVGCFF